jgi:hypothetical protein
MPATNPSERLHRWIRATIMSFLELAGLVLVFSVIGSWLWWLYTSGPDGRTITMASLSAVAISLWMVMARERARAEEREQIRGEQAHRAHHTDQPRGLRMGGDGRPGEETVDFGPDDPPTRRFKSVDDTTEWTKRWDFHPDLDR